MTAHPSPVFAQLAERKSDAERAELLVALPFEVIHQHAAGLRQLCERIGFAAGEHYVDAAQAMLCAVRAGRHWEAVADDFATVHRYLQIVATVQRAKPEGGA